MKYLFKFLIVTKEKAELIKETAYISIKMAAYIEKRIAANNES